MQQARENLEKGEVNYKTRRLTESDITEYLSAGTRKNKNKVAAINAGKKLILTSQQEITDFINGAIEKKAGDTTVAYGKVNDRLAEEVLKESKGKIAIKDNYLELIANNLQHAYEEHSIAKQVGDIPLQRKDFENIPEYLDSFDEVLYAIEYSSGNVKVCVSKKLPNGRILIIETVSKSRGSLQFKNAIGVTEEKYRKEYINKYKKRAETNTRGNESSKNALHDASSSNNSIYEKTPTVKNNISSEAEKYSEDESLSYKKLSPIKDTEGFAKKILRQNKSGQDAEVLSGQLAEMSKALAESDYMRAVKIATEAARGVIEASSSIDYDAETATETLASKIFTECMNEMEKGKTTELEKAVSATQKKFDRFVVESAKYGAQQKARIKRQERQLKDQKDRGLSPVFLQKYKVDFTLLFQLNIVKYLRFRQVTVLKKQLLSAAVPQVLRQHILSSNNDSTI